MHGRLLHDAATGDDRVAFGLPYEDKPGASVDPDLELDQRFLLHGRRVQRVRHLRQSRCVSDRDNFLFGHLHREWRIRHLSGRCDRQLTQNLPKEALPVSAV
jgi:hypothetical protein